MEGEWNMVTERWWIYSDRRKLSTWRKMSPAATMSTTDLTRTALESMTDFHSKRPAIMWYGVKLPAFLRNRKAPPPLPQETHLSWHGNVVMTGEEVRIWEETAVSLLREPPPHWLRRNDLFNGQFALRLLISRTCGWTNDEKQNPWSCRISHADRPSNSQSLDLVFIMLFKLKALELFGQTYLIVYI